MKEIVSVDPFRCRMWEYHDRLEQHVDESTCKAEIESIRRHGQLVPTLGRWIHGDSAHDLELIYGARRRFVAMHLNVPLIVEIRQISDAEAVLAMDIENRHRVDVSPYERGVSYRHWLRCGLFRSQEEISEKLRISASQVSRVIKLAQLPTVVVSAFTRPADICETWANDLTSALEDSERRAAICAKCRVISQMLHRPSPREIYRTILSVRGKRQNLKMQRHDEVVSGGGGRPLFRIRYLANSVVIVLPLERTLPSQLAQVKASVYDALNNNPPPESAETLAQ